MSARNYNARQFTEVVYRRLVVLRTLEQLGGGVLAGSLLATGLMVIAIWQSLPTVPILLFSGSIGLLTGISLAIIRRPTRWQSIIETDRQLHFDELLATALSTTSAGNDFTATVTAMADARCAHRLPSEVLIRRLGLRSWTAIGLAMSVAITLAIIPFGPSRSQASDADRSILSAAPLDPASASPASTFSPIATVNNPSSDTASPASNDQTQIAPSQMDSKTQPGAPAAPPESETTVADPRGAGGGQAQSHVQSSAPLQPANLASHTPSHTGNPNAEVAGGGSPTETSAGHGPAKSSTVSDGRAPTNVTPQWSGEATDPAGCASSNDSTLPAEDREMIKDFFQR